MTERTPPDLSDELASILDFIRHGDVLIVVKLDRLGRNTRDVLNLVHELEEKGASLSSDYLSLPSIPAARWGAWS
jgi:DNA invertase Pin-like site-specific DNA recombinase